MMVQAGLVIFCVSGCVLFKYALVQLTNDENHDEAHKDGIVYDVNMIGDVRVW